MFPKKNGYLYSYLVIIFGLIISGYLLFHHFSIFSGKLTGTDLCSVFFGKGCNVASLSRYSVFLKIPLGGWGMVYLVILLCLIFFSQIFISDESDEFIQIAFWISLLGIMFSLFYIVLMIAFPPLFCPFCTIFHILNFILFFLIRRMVKKPFADLLKGFSKAFGIVFLAKPVPAEFNKLKWLAIVFPFILAITFYQWALMQEQNITIERLSGYNPLTDIEQFEANEVFDIQISPDDPVLGPSDAPVSLIVFSDFQCSMCEMFATTFKYLLEYNKDNLNIRFKYFPLSSECNTIVKENMHPIACKAAKASEAARLQGKFWEYHDSLFVQPTLKNEEQLFDVARMLKLDMEKFESDYHSSEIQTKINRDIQEGNRLKLDGTPTAFLNGRKLRKLSEKNINLLVKFSETLVLKNKTN